jgi:DnaJ-class molecular chaperone
MKEQLERQFAASTASTTSTSSVENKNIPAIERYGDSRQTATSHTLRQRLEMQWQVTDQALQNDECDVYQPASCGGQTCTTCHGQGHGACRFCQGTCTLRLRTIHDDGTVETANVACQICNATGRESCRACQGTGWVADWTSIGGVHVGGGGGSGGGLLP